MPPRVSGEVLENARFPIFKKRLLQAQAYNIKIKVNPNTTFYSYYFFPRAPRSDFEVLFLCVMNKFAADLGLIADLVLD